MKRMINDADVDHALIADIWPDEQGTLVRVPDLDGPVLPRISNVTFSCPVIAAAWKAWRMFPALRNKTLDFSLLKPDSLCWDTAKADKAALERENRNNRLRSRALEILEINPGLYISQVVIRLQHNCVDAHRLHLVTIRNIINPAVKGHRPKKR